MANAVNTLLAAENKAQMDEVREFLTTLAPEGQRALLDFFQGAKFMQNLYTAQERLTAQPAQAGERESA